MWRRATRFCRGACCVSQIQTPAVYLPRTERSHGKRLTNTISAPSVQHCLPTVRKSPSTRRKGLTLSRASRQAGFPFRRVGRRRVVAIRGAYFPITTHRLPDCPYETDTFGSIVSVHRVSFPVPQPGTERRARVFRVAAVRHGRGREHEQGRVPRRYVLHFPNPTTV
jgi:hypothetical protein